MFGGTKLLKAVMIYGCYIDPLHPILQAKIFRFPESQEIPPKYAPDFVQLCYS